MILALLLCAQFTYAEAPHPKEPKGWVELISLEPAILSWVKGKPDQQLKDAPNFVIQKFPRSEKFEKFIKEKPIDKDSCRDLKEEGWNQTWCLREKSVLVILSRNEDSDAPKIKKTLKEWVLTHE